MPSINTFYALVVLSMACTPGATAQTRLGAQGAEGEPATGGEGYRLAETEAGVKLAGLEKGCAPKLRASTAAGER